MEQSLNDLFKGILNDESLQAQIKQAQEQQARQQEQEWGKPISTIGKEYFIMLSHPDEKLPADLTNGIDQLSNILSIQKPVVALDLSAEGYKDHYLGRIIGNIDAVKNGPNIEQREVGARLAKHFLYGFGNAALEAGDINTALVTLDKGGWLDDEYIGQSLQMEITEKVSNLDPMAKVQAAMTWDRIQKAKAPVSSPNLTLVPPTT